MNAISDNNVLPFRVDYVGTMKEKQDIDDEYVIDIDREGAYTAGERIAKTAEYILKRFRQKTYNGQFNSIFAVASIRMAKLYYEEFRKKGGDLKAAVIFSQSTNNDDISGILGEENSEDTSGLETADRDFLASAINDYNAMFHTNFDTAAGKFHNYYKDVSMRMKEKKIDLLIVVNMFLTGFDAPTLNTLWLDKSLKMHGLIQAFSRTNRILNSIKTFGNIVCFRDLREDVNEAIARFGTDEAQSIAILRRFEDYYNGYDDENGKHFAGYVEMIAELKGKFPLDEADITGEKRQKEFIALFGAVLKMRNLLRAFDKFEEEEKEHKTISDRDFQDYTGRYLDLRDEWKKYIEGKNADINDDVVFELELVGQTEINIDYILLMVKRYHEGRDKEILISIRKAIDASPELRSKKQLIENFIGSINTIDDIAAQWKEYTTKQRELDLEAIIIDERLKPEGVKKFLDECFRHGEIRTAGTAIDDFMPPVSRFRDNRSEVKQRIIERLKNFLDKYRGV